MGLIVQKFGGSSVRDRERLLRAMRIVRRTWEQGDDVVVVLSAQGDTTDALLARARELTEEPPLRELDALLATGETASVALGAIALASLGVPAVSLSGWQVPVGTDGTHGGANVRSVGAERIRQELAQRRVVLAAGFQGVDAAGDVTTLGRGGSDTSAAALAAFLGAERCIIYTDVDGVYTTDPRVCPTARRLAAVSCDQMLRLAANGAQVLHDRSVALAARHGVTVEVRSCEEGSVGTLVVPRAESGEVTGVTRSRRGEVTRVTAIGRALPSLAAIRAAVSALEAAGVFSIVLECVPSGVAKAVTEAVGVPILGIGAGPYVDCQVLLTHDLLDMYGDFTPRFVKQFAHIRRAMVEGLNAFHEEALSGQFPTPDYSFNRVVEGYEV